MANKFLVKNAEAFRQVLGELTSGDAAIEANNETFGQALGLYVAQCGGDMSKPTHAQNAAFSEAIANWLANTIEAL